MSRLGRSVRTILVTLHFPLLIVACTSSKVLATQSPNLEIHTPSAFIPATSTATSTATSVASGVTTIPSIIAAKTAVSSPEVNFKVAVIVDKHSASVTRQQAQAIVGEGSTLLRPFAPFGLEMVSFVEDGNGGSTMDMANRIIASNQVDQLNGIVIFSFGDAGRAKSSGAYSFLMSAPAGFRNTFAPLEGDPAQIGVAVVDFDQRYMPCGYGPSATVQSATSLGGECRNKPGTACVQHNGYSMCSNAVANIYASTPTHYIASTLVYELLQPFAPGGEKDNYDTTECSTHMGYPAGFFDLQESQYYNDLCPFVYENFVKSHKP